MDNPNRVKLPPEVAKEYREFFKAVVDRVENMTEEEKKSLEIPLYMLTPKDDFPYPPCDDTI